VSWFIPNYTISIAVGFLITGANGDLFAAAIYLSVLKRSSLMSRRNLLQAAIAAGQPADRAAKLVATFPLGAAAVEGPFQA
jgi:hypothetical protein